MIQRARMFLGQTATLILAILIFVALICSYNQPGIVIDDAFISFRYAENLASGQGLVFNLGEKVEGYTNFFWTVLLSIGPSMHLSIISWSKLLATVAGIGVIVCLYFSARQLFPHPSWLDWLPIAFFISLRCFARYAVSGMETLLFTCLLMWATCLCIQGSQKPQVMFGSGILFALTAMTRPEGFVYWGLALLVYCIYAWRKIGWLKGASLLLMGFLLVYVPYFLWRLGYYGYLFPNTYYAKLGTANLAQVHRGISQLLSLFRQWNLLPLVAIVPLTWKKHFSFAVLLMTVFILCTVAYFVWVGDFIVWFGPRFIMPVVPYFLLLILVGLRYLADACATDQTRAWISHLFFCIVTCGWLFLYTWPGDPSALAAFRVQMQGWEKLGQWINSYTPVDSAIATDAAGLIPYYARRKTLDMFGLTDLHIAHLDIPNMGSGTTAHEKFDPVYILAQNPDYIVSTWLDEKGNAISAGLDQLGAEMTKHYKLVAVAKIRNGVPESGQWVLPVSFYSKDLYDQGYVSGLFQRVTE